MYAIRIITTSENLVLSEAISPCQVPPFTCVTARFPYIERQSAQVGLVAAVAGAEGSRLRAGGDLAAHLARRPGPQAEAVPYPLGVAEYWQYHPTGDYLQPRLQGLHLVGGRYRRMAARESAQGTQSRCSNVLGLESRVSRRGCRFRDPVFEPSDGRRMAQPGVGQADCVRVPASAELFRIGADGRVGPSSGNPHRPLPLAPDSHPADAGAPVTATLRARPWLRRPRAMCGHWVPLLSRVTE